MKLQVYQKIGLSIGALLILIILFHSVLKTNISYKNIRIVKGELVSINKFKKRSSTSYHIKLVGNDTTFKILPDYIQCFNKNDFNNSSTNIKIVTLGIDPDNGLKSGNSTSVISIKKNNIEYIDLNCINSKIGKNKWLIPTIVLSIISIVLLFIKLLNPKK